MAARAHSRGERRGRLASGIDPAARTAALLEFMEQEIWAHVPAELRGQPHDPARDDEIVGYGPDGLPGVRFIVAPSPG